MTFGERLKALSGLSNATVGAMLLAIGTGAAVSAVLVSYSGLSTGTVSQHLLVDKVKSGGGGKLYFPKKQETEEEKRLRREAQGIIARIETQDPSEQLFDDSKDVVEQLKDEIRNLAAKERAFKAENKYAQMVRVQLAQEQLQAQIEEIDTAFVIMTIMSEVD